MGSLRGVGFVAVVAAALSSACGSSGAPAGGAGDGAAGTTGAAGQSAACAAFTPCGGDVVGTWRSDPACTPAKLSGGSCQGETFDVTAVVPTATWTFRADQTMTLALSVAGPIKVEATEDCLAKRGAGEAVTCTDASAGALYAKGIAYPGGKVGGSTCQARADGICACTITLVADPGSIGGTYSVAGSAISTSFGGDLSTIDHCVSGTTLKMKTRPKTVNDSTNVAVYLKQ